MAVNVDSMVDNKARFGQQQIQDAAHILAREVAVPSTRQTDKVLLDSNQPYKKRKWARHTVETQQANFYQDTSQPNFKDEKLSEYKDVPSKPFRLGQKGVFVSSERTFGNTGSVETEKKDSNGTKTEGVEKGRVDTDHQEDTTVNKRPDSEGQGMEKDQTDQTSDSNTRDTLDLKKKENKQSDSSTIQPEVSQMSRQEHNTSDKKNLPDSVKVTSVGSKNSVKRSNSCPAGSLAAGWKTSPDDWPLTPAEESLSFFTSQNSREASIDEYPSVEDIDQHSKYFRESQPSRPRPLVEDPQPEKRQLSPAFRTIAFGPTPPKKHKEIEEKPVITKNTILEPQQTSPHKSTHLHPMSLSSFLPPDIDMSALLHNVMNEQQNVIAEQIPFEKMLPLISESKLKPLPADISHKNTEKMNLFASNQLRQSRRRETNRRAARKCRMKQQQRETQLQKQFQEFETKNSKLNHELRQLMKIKANLEKILTQHLQSDGCKMKDKVKQSESSGSQTLSDMDPPHTSKDASPATSESSQQSFDPSQESQTLASGLYKRRMLSHSPRLPKLKLQPKPSGPPSHQESPIQPRTAPISAAGLPSLSPSRVPPVAVSPSVVMPPVVIGTETPLTVTAMEEEETNTGKDQVSTCSTQGVDASPASSHVISHTASGDLQPVKPPSAEKDKKDSRNKPRTKVKIKQVTADEMKNILRKGAKVVCAQDKNGRNISVEQVFQDTFKRPYDVKPLPKVSQRTSEAGVSTSISVSYQKGLQDASQGKSTANPHLYKQALATYAMKHGLPTSSREQVLAHVKAKQRAKESLAKSRKDPIPSDTTQEKKVITQAIPQLSDRQIAVSSLWQSQTPEADRTEPLFGTSGSTIQSSSIETQKVESTTPQSQLLRVKHFKPHPTGQVLKSNSTAKTQEADPHSVAKALSKHVKHTVTKSSNQVRTPKGDVVLIHQSVAADAKGQAVQQTYTLHNHDTISSAMEKAAATMHQVPMSYNTAPNTETRGPLISSKTASDPPPSNQHQPLMSSSGLTQMEVHSDTSMAVSALLQLKSGVSDSRSTDKEVQDKPLMPTSNSLPSSSSSASVGITSAMNPASTLFSFGQAGPIHPQKVLFYPGLPVMLHGTTPLSAHLPQNLAQAAGSMGRTDVMQPTSSTQLNQ